MLAVTNMIFNRPASNSAALFDQIGDLLLSNAKPDALALARLRRDAGAVLKTKEVAAGHILLSGVAALEWDAEVAKGHVDKALALEGSSWTLVNSIVTFNLLMRPDLAAELADAVSVQAPSDPQAVNHAAAVYVALGRVSEAARMQTRCIDLNPSARFDMDASELLAALQRAEVSEEWLGSELLIARQVLIDAQIRTRSLSYDDKDDPDGAPFISMALEFFGDIEQEFQLEDELAQRLAQDERWNPSRLAVQIHYFPAEEDALVAC